MAPTRIYARWREQLALSLPDHLLPIPAHAYDAPVQMAVQPHRGDHVQLIALSPMVYRTFFAPLGTNIYDMYDPQVEGTVAGVFRVSPERLAFAIENTRDTVGVPWVLVTAPFVPEEMLPPGDEECPPGWLTAVLGVARSTVGLQRDAVVVDGLGDVPTPPVVLHYPDPRVRRCDRMLTERAGRTWKPYDP
ncbi:hypothetical protein C8T65DRAFT_735482 [Cerioporus squamosus]|nr:hypothetical protein C8T65DRAFT_735482 [Cerioporus squamosus]